MAEDKKIVEMTCSELVVALMAAIVAATKAAAAGAKDQFTAGPGVVGPTVEPKPFSLHTWRTAMDIGHMATDAEALRYTDMSRKACLAQAEFEQANKPESQWQHFEPRW